MKTNRQGNRSHLSPGRGMRLVQDFKQRRIEECAKEIRYWHRMQADMGHAGKNLREILFRYIT